MAKIFANISYIKNTKKRGKTKEPMYGSFNDKKYNIYDRGNYIYGLKRIKY